MSEFDAFESAGQQEADPAADFLAREQDQLAELGDDTLTGTATTDNQQNLFGGEMGAPVESQGGDDLLAQFDSPAMASSNTTDIEPQPDVAADSELDNQQSAELAADANPEAPIDDVMAQFDSPAQPAMAGTMDSAFGDMGQPQENDLYSAISQVDTERAEPEKIRIWREEQKERLEKKDAEETQKMEEWRQVARQELEDWYKHRDEQLQKTKISNREGEAAFIKERDETLPGQAWEKICRNCEFNPKNSKATKDVSRMRSILLQLKQTPLVR